MINLSGVIHSPMLSQTITIMRTSGTWENGGFIAGPPKKLNMTGIVTVASARELVKVPEGDRQSGAMKVLTTERLYVTGEINDASNCSDVLLWRGERYRIYSVSPDTDYGFYRSIAMRIGGA